MRSKKHHRLLRILVFTIILFFLVILFVNYKRFSKLPIPQDEVSYGFSFAPHPYAVAGLDWKKSYIELLDRFNFKWVRIAFYWDQSTDQAGNLNLTDLTFQIEEAQKRNVSVIIAIGAKTPYYPEVYIPNHLTKDLKFGQELGNSAQIKKALLDVESNLIPKIATYSAITYWQVENEPYAGTRNNWTVGEDLLSEEIKVIKKNDPSKRPIILTHPGPFVWDHDWQKLLKHLAMGDVLAVNYFPKTRTPDVVTINLLGKDLKLIWPDFINIPVYIWGSISPDFEKVKNTVEAHGNKLWIMEMQAEPYLSEFKYARGKIFVFTPEDILKADLAIRKAGIHYIGFWGANWWLLSDKNGDSEWINMVEKVVEKRPASN